MPVDKLEPAIRLNTSLVTLQTHQVSSSAIKVSGLMEGDYVDYWESEDENIVFVGYDGTLTAFGKVGETKVTVTLGSGLQASVKVKVSARDIAECAAVLSQTEYTYDGSPKEPEVTVKDGDTDLVKDTDFTVSYTDNTDTGTAKAVISGVGSYTGTLEKSFTILKADQTPTVSVSSSALKVGETADIMAEGFGTISYSSNNEDIAIVDQSGHVTARAAGTAEITVTASGDSNHNPGSTTASIVVSEAGEEEPQELVKITRIEISGNSTSVEAGKTISLHASVTPENASNKVLSWSSSDESAAVVDPNGVVTAFDGAQGKTVMITAAATDGSRVQDTCILQITAPGSGTGSGQTPSGGTGNEQTPGSGTGNEQSPDGDAGNSQKPADKSAKVTRIKLSALSHKIAAGKKVRLTAEVLPKGAANKAVTWKSSNTKVATVNAKGVVTVRKKTGGKSVTITATAADGSGVQAGWKITSMKGVVKKVAISGSTSVKAGKSLRLKAKVTSSAKANKSVKWSSSNTKYATVTASGVVRTKKAGKGKKVKITAMATDGSGKKKTVTIRIK